MEGDASSASYFLAGAAITGGTITVEGCGTSSLQVLIFFWIMTLTYCILCGGYVLSIAVLFLHLQKQVS